MTPLVPRIPAFRRGLLLSLLLAVWFASAAAYATEPLPPYADTRSLREDASLHAVAFSEPESRQLSVGIACGDRGTILRSDDGGLSWSLCESKVQCRLSDVVWVGPQRVVVVGGTFDRITQISRGVALYSNDAGRSWQQADDQELTRFKSLRRREEGGLVARCDWSHSLLTDQVESRDGGTTWHAAVTSPANATVRPTPTPSRLSRWVRATGVPVAIRDACQINASQLCAVGDHGVVLTSPDRGRSWRATHGGKRRTSVLLVANDPESVAWSLLANEALENRNRVALLLHDAGEESKPSGVRRIELAHLVAVMLGASGADLITADDSDLSRAAVDWIDVHRPAVVVIDQSLPSLVRQAFFRAATSAGVRRIVESGLDVGGNIALHRHALLPKSGALASDLFADAMHYLAPQRLQTPPVSLRTLYDAATTPRRGESVVGGIRLDAEQSLSAPAPQASRRQLQIVQARLKNSQRISDFIEGSRSSNQFGEMVDAALNQTAKQERFRLAWTMYLEATARPGGIELQEILLDQIAARFPSMSSGRWAKLRLDSMRHSVERQRLQAILADSSTGRRGPPVAETVSVSPFQISAGGVQQVAAISPVVVPKPETHVLKRQNDREPEVDLAWEFHPLVLISQEAARRRGDHQQLQVAGDRAPNLERLAKADSAWSGLLTSVGPQLVRAHHASVPPKLDGILGDECWDSALPSAGRTTPLRMAYDNDYVYLAIKCPSQQLEADPFPNGKSRQQSQDTIRDHNLATVDRMLLSIDIDQDLMTFMQLQVSDSGRTHDAIDGNPAWQPTWYVATRRSNHEVTFEIAVLRRDLVELPIAAGESWFLSATAEAAGSQPSENVVPDPNQWVRVVFQPK